MVRFGLLSFFMFFHSLLSCVAKVLLRFGSCFEMAEISSGNFDYLLLSSDFLSKGAGMIGANKSGFSTTDMEV